MSAFAEQGQKFVAEGFAEGTGAFQVRQGWQETDSLRTGGKHMARTVGIGHQDFEQVITNDYFYIGKTDFIRDRWENRDAVTLIARPRRFGKTLNMSMLEKCCRT